MLVYDITRRSTFDNIDNWLIDLRTNGDNNILIALIGNKSDLEEKRAISKEEAEEICKKNNIGWGGEISIKDMSIEELEDLFVETMKIIYKDIGNPQNSKMIAKKLSDGERVKKKKRNNNIC